jgi:hypothetical protein
MTHGFASSSSYNPHPKATSTNSTTATSSSSDTLVALKEAVVIDVIAKKMSLHVAYCCV